MGADAQPGGLTVHGLALTPLAKTHAWNFTVTLTHSAEGAKEIQGTLSLAVEGVRADKLTTLDWPALAGASAGDGLPFDFKYFQQVQGTLMLPGDFTPNRVRVTLQPQPQREMRVEQVQSGRVASDAGLAGRLGLPLSR